MGAKAESAQIIEELAGEGRIVLFTSTELPEYVHVCDRVLVFYRGRVCGELTRDRLTDHRLLEAINTGNVDGSSDGPRGEPSSGGTERSQRASRGPDQEEGGRDHGT